MRYRVLVVEDEMALRETLKVYLEPRYKVVTAANALDAADSLERHNFSIMLVDLGLPDACGLDLLKQVIKNRPNMIVIALTGDKSEKSVRTAIEAGVDGYLVKPVTPDTLHDRIDKVIFKRNLSQASQ